MFTLYGVWQWVHERAVTKTAGAIDRAHSLYDFEQAIHLPSELTLQNALLHHRLVMQFLNVYYGGAHVPAVGIVLVWLFWRHRDRYGRIRWTLALSIAGCLAIQTIPVAPPRFLPELGFVDAGLLYHLSVYGAGGSGISNQLAAMPSLHVGWAVLVGVAVVAVSTSQLALAGARPPGADRDRRRRHRQPLVARRRRRGDDPRGRLPRRSACSRPRSVGRGPRGDLATAETAPVTVEQRPVRRSRRAGSQLTTAYDRAPWGESGRCCDRRSIRRRTTARRNRAAMAAARRRPPGADGDRGARGQRGVAAAARRARQAAAPGPGRRPARSGLAVPRAVGAGRRGDVRRRLPRRRDHHRHRPGGRPAVRDRGQRRHRQGRHVLPDHGEEAPARPGDRPGEPAAVHLPRRLRRGVPARAGPGVPRPGPLRADLLQPGDDVGDGHRPDRRGARLVHRRRGVRAGDERRGGDRARAGHDLPRRPAAGAGRDR